MVKFDLANEKKVSQAVRAAIDSAEHLKESDAGAVTMALRFAEQVQDALDSGDPSRRDKLMYGPFSSLGKVLNDLGLTPQGRVDLGLQDAVDQDDEEF